MQSITKTDFATLSVLGCYKQGYSRLACSNQNGQLLTIVPGKLQPRELASGEWLIHYFVQFDEEIFQSHYEGAAPMDVVQWLKDSRNLTLNYEWLGGDAFILCEIVSSDIRDLAGLLKSRMRSLAQSYNGLHKRAGWMSEEDLPKDCEAFQRAWRDIIFFGHAVEEGQDELLASHPKTCQKCRFWKAEQDSEVEKRVALFAKKAAAKQ